MKNYRLLIITVLLLSISVFTLFSLKALKPSSYEILIKKQIVSGILAILIIIMMSNLNYLRIKPFSQIIYFFSIVLLILTFFYESKHGSHRWIQLSKYFYFQPSEFVKVALVLYLADLFSPKSICKVEVVFVKGFFILAIPLIIIALQPDLGTAAMSLFVFFAMFFNYKEVKLKHFFVLLLIILLFIPIGYKYLLKDYQRKRLSAYLNPEKYALKEGYQSLQAKKLIGSGGLYGNFSSQKSTKHFLRLIPERHNDFIFTSIAYKFGFVGASTIITLYLAFIFLALSIYHKTKEGFGQFISIGLISIFTFQAFFNIGMNLGLFPITGITLPFLSYGGSSNVSFGILVGLLISVKKYEDKNFRSYHPF